MLILDDQYLVRLERIFLMKKKKDLRLGKLLLKFHKWCHFKSAFHKKRHRISGEIVRGCSLKTSISNTNRPGGGGRGAKKPKNCITSLKNSAQNMKNFTCDKI